MKWVFSLRYFTGKDGFFSMGKKGSFAKAPFLLDLRREFSHYNASKFSKDVLSGLTVAAVALPLALAFGVSSGLDAASGLITAIIAGLLIGSLSGASFQISGPTGAMAAILAGLAARHGAEGVLIAGMVSGVILLFAAFLRVGALVSYIPSPVITGFTSGIAVIIALGQLDNFFGTTSQGENAILKLLSYGSLGFHPQAATLGYGLLVVGIMIVWPKKWNARFPSSLLGIILALILQMVFDLSVTEVGAIPRTLLSENRLRLDSISLEKILGYASPALGIATLGMVESLLCGASAGKMKGEKLNATRELFAQGLGNFIIPFFGGVPATAAIARTSVAIKSGQQTRLTGIFHSLGLLASMFLLGPFMGRIPLSALAGVLMVTAWRMNEWHAIKKIFRRKIKTSMAQYLVTLVATVIFDLTTAILIGIVFSMVMFVIKSHKISIEVDDVTSDFPPKVANTKVVYIDGSLFFGSQDMITKEVEELVKGDTFRIIFSLRGVPSIDHSSVDEFITIVETCKKNHIDVLFCGVQGGVMSMFRRLEFTNMLGEGAFFSSVVTALESIS
ncbi:sulfate permease-like transporter, MFS superfamily [Sphaerochaeta pleomorpha str. Grapes]|uniref:Sulfate permease-like transporter, MFS superfamily n=2 Tax=Sphaerochaeta TaxID=399320 RepID=G8QV48_SPHPG|nr:sulfate permease-like transporter, MFS superfamily [Sphaerochaeta pleomorpha str. Grapes]